MNNTYVVWRRDLRLVNWYNGPENELVRINEEIMNKAAAYESKPTPKPLINLPAIIMGSPLARV